MNLSHVVTHQVTHHQRSPCVSRIELPRACRLLSFILYTIPLGSLSIQISMFSSTGDVTMANRDRNTKVEPAIALLSLYGEGKAQMAIQFPDIYALFVHYHRELGILFVRPIGRTFGSMEYSIRSVWSLCDHLEPGATLVYGLSRLRDGACFHPCQAQLSRYYLMFSGTA